MVKALSDNMKAQTGKEPDEDQQKTLRDQAWQALITQNLVEAQIKKLGLTVTHQELVDWVRGPNPPEDSAGGTSSIRPAISAGMSTTNSFPTRTSFSVIPLARDPNYGDDLAREV